MNDAQHTITGPLTGIRVVDFSGYIAGPYCTMMMGDMGADVIKIEPPTGEQWRHQDPFAPGESLSFMALNRNKRSVILNLKDPEDRATAMRLLATADVLVHNWRPGVAERLGLGYEHLSAHFPRLIYATNSAYGPKGPRAKQGGYDLVIQALSGLLASNPTPDGAVPKRYAGIAVVDFTAGNKLAYGITCALLERSRTGLGTRVDSSLMEAALGLQRQKLIAVEGMEKADLPSGNTKEQMRAAAERSAASGARELYYRTYQTRDSFITVGCLNVPQRQILLSMLQMSDPWHANPDQVPPTQAEDDVRRALVDQAEARFKTEDTANWVKRIEAADIPCAPVQMASEVLRDTQVLASDYMYDYLYPGCGTVSSVGTGVRVGEQRGVHRPPPKLGEHTQAVLAEMEVTHPAYPPVEPLVVNSAAKSNV